MFPSVWCNIASKESLLLFRLSSASVMEDERQFLSLDSLLVPCLNWLLCVLSIMAVLKDLQMNNNSLETAAVEIHC